MAFIYFFMCLQEKIVFYKSLPNLDKSFDCNTRAEHP